MMKSRNRMMILVAAVAAMVWLGFAQQADTAKDPVCGMSVAKASAKWTLDYKGTTYYFCSEGCKTAFAKAPEKYLGAAPEAKGMMGGGMHGQMKAGDMKAGGMSCPMMMEGVERKVELTKDGAIITLSSKNPDTVKKIQEHLAKMKEGGCPMAKTPATTAAAASAEKECAGGCCKNKK